MLTGVLVGSALLAGVQGGPHVLGIHIAAFAGYLAASIIGFVLVIRDGADADGSKEAPAAWRTASGGVPPTPAAGPLASHPRLMLLEPLS